MSETRVVAELWVFTATVLAIVVASLSFLHDAFRVSMNTLGPLEMSGLPYIQMDSLKEEGHALSAEPVYEQHVLPLGQAFPDEAMCTLAALYVDRQPKGRAKAASDKLALHESAGFFSEADELWRLRRARHIRQRCAERRSLQMCPGQRMGKECWPACVRDGLQSCRPAAFWQIHFEPSFSCDSERRLGPQGEGGKWVCDPHKIAARTAAGDGCLVYSIGSEGRFGFEEAVHREISAACEIHTFDQNDWSVYSPIPPPRYVAYHVGRVGPWPGTPVSELYEKLGHGRRTLDILKIDCEGCEWTTYRSWLTARVRPRQILVELHNFDAAREMFQFLNDRGYVIAHKEPNIEFSGGACVEYVFLYLGASFSRAEKV
mmetsp:Transcript_75742/g.225811  ORF Transcript_75742/g.225811 Transcript_75742/m.225811 type:complete len:374 (-) Transcript_75742:98-1219(-)